MKQKSRQEEDEEQQREEDLEILHEDLKKKIHVFNFDQIQIIVK